MRFDINDGNDGRWLERAEANLGAPGGAPPSYASFFAEEKGDDTLIPAANTVPDERKNGRDSQQDVGTRVETRGLGVGHAVMEAVEQLAQYSAIPGVSEATKLVVALVNLQSDRSQHAPHVPCQLR